MESSNEKLSIKNLLFSKAIPNFVLNVPTRGHTLFACMDCGDKFTLESSYKCHINRQSIKISYQCRHCRHMKVFYNRCKMLSHLRSHGFKTATINVTDIKIEPLPMDFFNLNQAMTIENEPPSTSSTASTTTTISTTTTTSTTTTHQVKQNKKRLKTTCYECKNDISCTGILYKDRAKHYMQHTNEVYTCPVCMLTLPTICGIKAHLRLHLKYPPYYCPECGIHLHNKSMAYPYIHDCEGFKMMRATCRLKCPIAGCHIFHPNEFKIHLKNNHMKKVYKCPFCFIACFSESTMATHLASHSTETTASLFYQCEMCPGRLVLENQINYHLNGHLSHNAMYPCWSCGTILEDVPAMIKHHIEKHGLSSNIYDSMFTLKNAEIEKPGRVYRVVKRCDQCKRSFTYKCNFGQIRTLPNECPYKCTSKVGASSKAPSVDTIEEQITCPICKNKISEKWENIKKHYANHHKRHRCLDAQLIVKKLDSNTLSLYTKKQSNKYAIVKRVPTKSKNVVNITNLSNVRDVMSICSMSRTISNKQFVCNKCKLECENKQQFEAHIVTHRDPCMAYQCMECGQSFVVKPSFSTHLLIEHGISDVQDYIDKNQCYNENALLKYQCGAVSNEPLRENQCSICREQFINTDDLEKHFRVHGMAFLMKKKNSP